MQAFLKSERGKQLREELVDMAKSELYNTRSTYSPNQDDQMTFVDRHMNYMCQYPELNYEQYISNLRLMTKIR